MQGRLSNSTGTPRTLFTQGHEGFSITSGNFYSIRPVLSASQTVLKPGETATPSLTVIRVQELNEPATLKIVDHSPQIVMSSCIAIVIRPMGETG
jgi:hypothetical protein